jgi:hypothetical protein
LVIAFAILVSAAFLLGYIPEFQRAERLATELKAAQENQHQTSAQLQVEGIRNHFSRAYLETTRNNFGLASQHATRAFDQIASASANTANGSMQTALLDVSGQRSSVLAGLAKADPNTRNQIASILDEMDKASGH